MSTETTAPYRGSLQVKFWSGTYSPEKALDPLDNFTGAYGPTGDAFEVKPGGAAAFRPAKAGATLFELRDWMTDNGLAVTRRDRVGQQSNRAGWQGLYVLTIGPEVRH
jgi:hypothetical protein